MMYSTAESMVYSKPETMVYSKAHNKEEKKARAQKKIQDRAIAAAGQMLSSYPSGDKLTNQNRTGDRIDQ